MVIDDALQLVYSQHHRIISRLYPAAMPRVSLEQLREGPLGEDLSRLAHIAMGAMRAGRTSLRGFDATLQMSLTTSLSWKSWDIWRLFVPKDLGQKCAL